MGLGTIMESRMCLLLAFGSGKAQAVAACVEGPVTASVPASILQFHPRTKVLLDAESASSLARADYYQWVYKNKPTWQIDL
jgi:glucosamine-6-phosphate deaminase